MKTTTQGLLLGAGLGAVITSAVLAAGAFEHRLRFEPVVYRRDGVYRFMVVEGSTREMVHDEGPFATKDAAEQAAASYIASNLENGPG
jgi:hypothetical protein